MPNERTKAVIDTGRFLKTLSDEEGEIMRSLVRSVALQLLQHYRLDVDIDVSATALPGVWAPSHEAQRE